MFLVVLSKSISLPFKQLFLILSSAITLNKTSPSSTWQPLRHLNTIIVSKIIEHYYPCSLLLFKLNLLNTQQANYNDTMINYNMYLNACHKCYDYIFSPDIWQKYTKFNICMIQFHICPLTHMMMTMFQQFFSRVFMIFFAHFWTWPLKWGVQNPVQNSKCNLTDAELIGTMTSLENLGNTLGLYSHFL